MLELVTDKLRSYGAAHREVMPSAIHCTEQYANNRAEVSHEPTRQRERQMRKFKSPGQAQRFLSVHGLVQNFFRVGRRLLRARNSSRAQGARVACLGRSSEPGVIQTAEVAPSALLARAPST